MEITNGADPTLSLLAIIMLMDNTPIAVKYQISKLPHAMLLATPIKPLITCKINVMLYNRSHLKPILK